MLSLKDFREKTNDVFTMETVKKGRNLSDDDLYKIKGGDGEEDPEALKFCPTLFIGCLIKVNYNIGDKEDYGTIGVLGICICNAKY